MQGVFEGGTVATGKGSHPQHLPQHLALCCVCTACISQHSFRVSSETGHS